MRLKPQGTAVELTLPGPVRLSTAGRQGQPACLGSTGVASILCSPSLPLRMSQSDEGRLFNFHVGFPFSQSAGSGLPDWRVSGGVPRPTQVFKTISRGSLRPSGFHNTKRLPAFSTVLAFAPMVRKRWWAKCWHLWRHPASGPRLPCGRRALRLRPRAVETGSFTQDRFDEAGKMAPSANALLTCTALASARRGRERARPTARSRAGCRKSSRAASGLAGFPGNSFYLKEQLTGSCGYVDLGTGQAFP